MRAVAEAAGCTPPAIYMHFADKQELFHAVCNVRWAEFNEAMDAAGQLSDDPLESLLLRGRAYVRFGLEHPEHYRLLMMTGTDDPHDGVLDTNAAESNMLGAVAFQHLVAAVERCIESGALRPTDPFNAAIVVWAAAHGITSLLITSPNFPWPDKETIIDEILTNQMTGLLAR